MANKSLRGFAQFPVVVTQWLQELFPLFTFFFPFLIGRNSLQQFYIKLRILYLRLLTFLIDACKDNNRGQQ